MSIVSFLSNVTADYAATLPIDPQEVFGLSGEKYIQINPGYGTSEERIILSSASRFVVKLKWTLLTDADHNSLFDWYHDPVKACGTARSFWWQPPAQYDSNYYVVRFGSRLESFLETYQIYKIASLLLVVLGNKP